jgi:hypothetical protein
MAFDPDKYLADQKPSFNPDAYLSSLQSNEKKPETSAGQAALEHYGNAATMGYLPHLQALIDKVMPDPNAVLDERLRADGFKVQNAPEKTYIQNRDENIARLAKEGEEHPVASGAGTVAGIVGGAVTGGKLAGGFAKGASALQRLKSAAKTGAAFGAIGNPGDIEGEVSPQIEERAKNALMGAALGTGGQLVGEGVGFTGKKLADYFKRKAEEKAFKTSGAMLKDFRHANEKGKVNELGRMMLDEEVVTPLTTPKTVANRLEGKIEGASQNLEDIITETEETGGKNFRKLKPAQRKTLQEASFRPQEVAESMKKEIRDRYKHVPEEKLQAAFDEIDSWLLKQPKVMGIRDTQQLKQEMNRFLKDSDFYGQPKSFTKEGTLAVRKGLKEGVERKADAFAEVMGEQGGQIKATNKRLGNMIEAQDIAQDRISRDAANRAFGLTDTIMMGGGMGGGAVAGGLLQGDIEGALKGAVIGSSLGGLNKLGRTYGNSLQATGFNNLSKMLAKTPKLAAFVGNNPTRMNMLANRLGVGTNYEKNGEYEPILGNDKVMGLLQQNPDLIERIQNPTLKSLVKKRLEQQKPEANRKPSDELMSHDQAREEFIKGN